MDGREAASTAPHPHGARQRGPRAWKAYAQQLAHLVHHVVDHGHLHALTRLGLGAAEGRGGRSECETITTLGLHYGEYGYSKR